VHTHKHNVVDSVVNFRWNGLKTVPIKIKHHKLMSQDELLVLQDESDVNIFSPKHTKISQKVSKSDLMIQIDSNGKIDQS